MQQKLQRMPHFLLRLEGTAVLITAIIFYNHNGFSWWWFALLLLAPDLAAVGYLHSEEVGSLCYNIVHTYVLPLALGLLAMLLGLELGLQLAIIWLAHIGLDRLVGYGLKYPDSFKTTHFSKV
ncbi:DUF4260 family protein [Candidatus Leptofilum sp.]|uniref:DUF4260 family protein n=1 Tax=Candidatus Leptofilum sp. TaxID=3241576 RepID=UPI003B58CB87